jgi:glycerol-3-phosphate dehydrogenase
MLGRGKAQVERLEVSDGGHGMPLYVIKVDGMREQGALINILRSKFTTYRQLAEAVLDKIEEALGARGASWTAGTTLPGGHFPASGFEALVSQLKKEAPTTPDATIRRLVRDYGTNARQILGSRGELGNIFGADLGENEVDF